MTAAARPPLEPGLVLQPRSYDDEDVQQLVAAVQQEYVVRYGGPDAATVEPGEFEPPAGRFVVGYLDGTPVATGGWRRLPGRELGPLAELGADVAEIKRMFVVATARRRGVARAVLAELERTATDSGIAALVLNTGREQPEAIQLYESSGYQPVPGFGHYATAPKALFYGKQLSASRP